MSEAHRDLGLARAAMQVHKWRLLILYFVLGLVSLLSRLFGLGHYPLWFDELYSYQVSSQKLPTLIRNSLCEPAPPLHFVFVKLTSGFGLWRTEWGLRWFSAVCGALILVVLFHLASRITNRWCAGLVWLMLLVSPTLMYYSQEARAYIMATLIATLTMSVVFDLSKSPKPSGRLWIIWAALSLAGLYTSYSYLMILSVQALFLATLFRLRRDMVIVSAVILLGILPLAPILWYNLGNSLERTAGSTPLTFPLMAQTLFAGELLRFGPNVGATWLPILLGGLAFIGVSNTGVKAKNRFGWYVAAQVVVPIVGYFFIAAWLFKWYMPSFQSRQFLVILPAFYILVAYGIQGCVDRLPARTGYLATATICAAVLLFSAVGLGQYWTGTKSPEGLALQMVSGRLRPEDGVVGLGLPMVLAASFYLPQDHRVYTTPQATDVGYEFDDDTLVLCGQPERIPRSFSSTAIRSHDRLWILTDTRREAVIRNDLVKGCQVRLQQMFGPFEVLLVEQCTG